MKLHISISRDYTSTTGLYSSVRPDDASIDKISSLCSRFTVPVPDLDKLHCTVMYSREGLAPVNQALRFSRPRYFAVVKGFNWWAGHDNDGYLVLELISGELQKEHQRLKSLGCVPSFADYTPHITIRDKFWFASDEEREAFLAKSQMANHRMRVVLNLSGQVVEDIKPPKEYRK